MVMDDDCETNCVIETTGWERLASIIKEQSNLFDMIQRDIDEFVHQETGTMPRQCRLLTESIENEKYVRIVLGHDYIYFTDTKTMPKIGALLSDMRDGGVRTIGKKQKINPNNKVFRIRTRRFLEDLCHGENGFPRADGAEEMLREYDTIQRTLPSMRRVCRPPPMEEKRVLELMSKWGTIKEDDFQYFSRDDGGVSGFSWFSVVKPRDQHKRAIEARYKELIVGGIVHSYPFMASQMFRVRL